MSNLVIYENITQLLTLKGVLEKKGRRVNTEDLGVISNAAMVVNVDSQLIEWVGPQSELPSLFSKVIDRFPSHGEIWFPEFIESHTHLVFGGHRYQDYGRRAEGMSYQEVAEKGGGILATITPTREATFTALLERALDSVDRFQKFGVGALEIKSGYGLTLESELKILHVIREMQEKTSVELISTFMPAHAVPPEFKGRADEYVDVICREWIPTVSQENLAHFFDAFVEQNYFTVDQARKMAEVAREHEFKIKFHVDQFSSQGGTELGIEMGATSLDHLENINEATIAKLAASETVAVLCPGASVYTNYPYAPARKLIDAGARVALSTDYNPGTSPTRNLPLMTTLACSQMGMTVAESIAAITYNAAAALGIEDRWGALVPGRSFRVATLKASSYEALPYSFGELD